MKKRSQINDLNYFAVTSSGLIKTKVNHGKSGLLFCLAGLLLPLFFTALNVTYLTNKISEVQAFEDYTQTVPDKEIQIEMVAVHGGSFLMGSTQADDLSDTDEYPQRTIEVAPFWIGRYEITWEQYYPFMRDNLSELLSESSEHIHEFGINIDVVSLPTPPMIDMSFGMGRDGFPAISMTQYAALMYTKWLTLKTGIFYRLPTEAEWEYACRGGTNNRYHFGNDPELLSEYGWYSGNSEEAYQKAGLKKPNLYGLYDMHGNVTEWTLDMYLEDYFLRIEDSSVNPWFRPDRVYPRSVRGGSWRDEPSDLRCSARMGSNKNWKLLDPQLPKSLWWHTNAPFVGFRIVRPNETPSIEEMELYWIEAMEDF